MEIFGHNDMSLYYEVLLPQTWVQSRSVFISKCPECEVEYSKTNMPFLMRCGHSICINCRAKFKEYLCTKCGVILFNCKDSTPNKTLLKQIETVNKEKTLSDNMSVVSKLINKNPSVKVENVFLEKFCMVLHCEKYIREILEKLSDFRSLPTDLGEIKKFLASMGRTELTGAVKKRTKKVDNLINVEQFGDVTSLYKMVREKRQNVLKSLKGLEIDFSHQKVLNLLDEEFEVFSYYRAEPTADRLVAEVKNDDFGLHIHGFKELKIHVPKLYFWFDENIHSFDKKYLFFNMSTRILGQGFTRRVYFKYADDFHCKDTLHFTVGLKGSLTALTFIKKDNNLTGVTSISKPSNWIQNLPSAPNQVGLLRVVPPTEDCESIRLLITVKVDKEENHVNNVLGICHSGKNFLLEIRNACVVGDYGICVGDLSEENVKSVIKSTNLI